VHMLQASRRSGRMAVGTSSWPRTRRGVIEKAHRADQEHCRIEGAWSPRCGLSLQADRGSDPKKRGVDYFLFVKAKTNPKRCRPRFGARPFGGTFPFRDVSQPCRPVRRGGVIR